jgi:hypothetical protein
MHGADGEAVVLATNHSEDSAARIQGRDEHKVEQCEEI